MTVPADDAGLLSRSAAGDRPAFSELMDRHSGAVYRLLVSLGASPDDAEDALQDCFVAAWRSARSFRGSGSARGWLFTIARNALRRQHRPRSGEPTDFDGLEALGVAAGWGVAASFDHRFEVLEELEWALRRIPENEREVVVMRDVEGFTGQETAEALGLSVAAVKSRLHRGRLRLMKLMLKEWANA